MNGIRRGGASLWLDAVETGAAAGFTIAARLWLVAVEAPWLYASTRREMAVMVAEKQRAAFAAALAVQRGLLRGDCPLDPGGAGRLMAAAFRPYHRRTRANARRLRRRLGG
ncbi:MAG: hypothetical protein KDG89_13065 [Geminicoccaceae bacterium]|nr:hypothetical protein [Geminicoccaceae bacterium]